ncbi:MAG: hypothetical protein HXX18_08825 [Bacteroidetes bacterium]|nr:hypothetical protein [Bacteroidota bacterium]
MLKNNMTRNSFKENINTIKEIYPGFFQIILDFASKRFIDDILREKYKFIWISNYELKNNFSWINCELPISDKTKMPVIARQISYDFIINYSDFDKIKQDIPNGLTLLQINKMPPDFLDLRRIKGKTRYDLLKKECDFLFEIDLPNAVDYGTLISPDKNYLIELLNDKKINWSDLP